MHLALVISSLNSGGAERVLSELASHWVTAGHDVSLITLACLNEKPFYPLDSAVNLIQLNQSQEAPYLAVRLKNILKRINALRRTFKNLKPDLILSFIDVMNLTTLLAAIGLKIPVIVSERTHPAYHMLPLLYQKARQILYPRAYRVVLQTDSAARYFKKLKNVIVIPNGVVKPEDTKISASAIVERIVSVGRLCPFKGFDTLIYAFTRLHQVNPHLQLVIYGAGAEHKNLMNLITSLHLEANVFLPGITRNIHQALCKADLFVFPSQYEGFPNALCEAMAIGLPVIASDCEGNRNIVSDHIDGRLFPVGNVEALADIMKELTKDFDQRVRLAKQAQAICERFHPERVLKLWDMVITSAVKFA